MPLQPINFAGIRPITPYTGQPTPDFINEFMQAFRRPGAMQEERQMNLGNIEKQRLANALEQQFGAREREGKIALDEAYRKYYESGGGRGVGGVRAPGLTNFDKASNALDRAIEQFGPDSPQAILAEQYLNKTAGQTLPAATQNRNIKTHLANLERQEISKAVQMPYLGTGSNAELLRDRAAYGRLKGKEKEAVRERLVNAALSAKLLPENATTVSVSINGDNPTDSELKAQEKALSQGWPEITNLATNNFPKEIQQEVNKRYSDINQTLSRLRNQETAAIHKGGIRAISRLREDEDKDISYFGRENEMPGRENNQISTVNLAREHFPEFQNYSDEQIMYWLGNSEIGKRFLKGL